MRSMRLLSFFFFLSLSICTSRAQGLYFSEIMYNSVFPGADSLEYIEIYNDGFLPIDLNGYTISPGIDHTFGNVTIQSGEYLLIAWQPSKIMEVFGKSAIKWDNGLLSDSGDELVLKDSSGQTIDSVFYDDAAPWPLEGDGLGSSIEVCDFSLDNSIGSNWHAAVQYEAILNTDTIKASPGENNCQPSNFDFNPPVVLTVSLIDASTIEVEFNEPVSNATNTGNYSGIPSISNITLNTFATVCTLDLAMPLTDGQLYTLTIDGVTDTSSNAMLMPQSFELLTNSALPDLVIQEIMYNEPSVDDLLEYLELYNNDATDALLGGCFFSDGLVFTFPAGTVMSPGEIVLLAKDSSLLRSQLNIDPSVRIFQWADGEGLNNSGELLRISNMTGGQIEAVNYDDNIPWPKSADGDGPSLEQCNPDANNDQPGAWRPSPILHVVIGNDSIYGTPGLSNCPDIVAVNEPAQNLTGVYPNPSAGQVNIHLMTNEATYQLIDLFGQKLLEGQLIKGSNTLVIEGIEAGFYLLIVTEKDDSEQIFKLQLIR